MNHTEDEPVQGKQDLPAAGYQGVVKDEVMVRRGRRRTWRLEDEVTWN